MLYDEKALITAAQEGREDAFEELYVKNKEKIAALIVYYIGNRQDAEDLLQEVFIKAFLSIGKFKPRPGAGFSSWLYRIGINCSLNFIKKRKRQHLYHHRERETSAVEADPVMANPEQTALRREINENLQQGLDTLSPKQRMVFVLKHFQGLRLAEIAQYMKCGEGSIRTHLYRAVTKLREQLSTFHAGANHEK